MGKQIIWYSSRKSKYYFGSENKFNKVLLKGSDDIIIAEQFIDMPMKFVEKITSSLNSNLKELVVR